MLLPGNPMSTVPFDATGASVASRSIGIARLPAEVQLALPKVLLCDLDGTLIDSMPTLADLATEVIEERYGTPRILARELYLATCGLPFVKQLEEIFPDDARNADASDRFEARKPARCNAIRMPADTRRALERPARAGRPHRGLVEQRHRERRPPSRATPGSSSTWCSATAGAWRRGARTWTPRRVSSAPRRQEMLFIGDSLHDGEIAEREGDPLRGHGDHVLAGSLRAALPSRARDSALRGAADAVPLGSPGVWHVRAACRGSG